MLLNHCRCRGSTTQITNNHRSKLHSSHQRMEKTVVLYPGLAVSHFVPMMQLAAPLLEHGYAVSVALIDPAVKDDIAFGAVVSRVAASMPSVRFHTLPTVEDVPDLTQDTQFPAGYLELIRRYNERLHDFLCSMRPRSVHAVVVDSLSSEALGVVKRLGIPGYNLFTSSASVLAAFAQLPTLLAEGGTSFKELGDTPLQLFGLPPMPASHLMAELLEDPESDKYKAMMASLPRILEADGTLVNTLESLEARGVAALRDPRCVLGRVLPPVYCVGPFVGSIAVAEAKERHECLPWLDGQPDRSVVFLCFGSIGIGNHSEEQLREIAVGLDKSGHRFLWVVRAPVSDDPEKPLDPCADPDIDALLPDGFMERTNGRGLVVKLWAPQADVLRHKATGAFVTHCGWNSVLEGVTAGVPMLCWPLYAEQKMNKLFMVGDMGIAVEMVGWQHGLVKAGEVEAKVRLVMDSEEGRELRARVAANKEDAMAAWNDGGSSRVAFAHFLADVASQQDRACTREGMGLSDA
ncbi:anthocyanidin 5,3-O-glucosyltransferase-like [Aegilops tauschii subsp. strangulata]|uniref:Glycosyltransferase n=1 Tax=Aegilops tauschii subsp. strangulata TaxID=200361 RepID=A0A453DUA5_AEGTS|nr:anthocyanidin 5,3-O-glucosyltransferase-like [Aegilops tauschii subsp. strangulata]